MILDIEMLLHTLLTLNKKPAFSPGKWVSLGITENCNPEHASMVGQMTSTKRKEKKSYRGEEKLGGLLPSSSCCTSRSTDRACEFLLLASLLHFEWGFCLWVLFIIPWKPWRVLYSGNRPADWWAQSTTQSSPPARRPPAYLWSPPTVTQL